MAYLSKISLQCITHSDLCVFYIHLIIFDISTISYRQYFNFLICIPKFTERFSKQFFMLHTDIFLLVPISVLLGVFGNNESKTGRDQWHRDGQTLSQLVSLWINQNKNDYNMKLIIESYLREYILIYTLTYIYIKIS